MLLFFFIVWFMCGSLMVLGGLCGVLWWFLVVLWWFLWG